MIFELTVLGNGSATPTYFRHPSAHVLNVHDHLFLIDCGEGTQIQFYRHRVKFHRINHIFITHLHGDHFLGLVGLLSTLHLQGRTVGLNIFGPADLIRIIDIQLELSDTILRYPVQFYPVDPHNSKKLLVTDQVEVTSIPLNHRVPCTGFLFKESSRERNLISSKIKEYKIPYASFDSLKKGDDFHSPDSTIIPNALLTLDPPKQRSYAYCSDTCYDESIIPLIKGVDILYHESTFLDELRERAKETYHSTAKQAGVIASKANVKKLIIGHFSARYKSLDPFLEEARLTFNNVYIAMEGEKYQTD
jgi:ribonuclease Z